MGVRNQEEWKKMHLEWASVWRAKCKEFQKGKGKIYEGFLKSLGARNQANSQKMHLEWASIWRATCKEFHRKMKDF